MKRNLLIRLLVVIIVGIMIISGCALQKKKGMDSKVLDSAKNLYSYQYNYSQGTALLNLIPPEMIKDVYENYDELKESGSQDAPISLREYATTNIVYLDYDTDCSIVWNKNTDDVRIEKTIIADREDYKQKQHK